MSRSAATACGSLIESQKPASPSSNDFAATAARGMQDDQGQIGGGDAETDAATAGNPARCGRCARRRRDASHAPTFAWIFVKIPFSGVEELLLHLRPAADAELVDREEAGPGRER